MYFFCFCCLFVFFTLGFPIYCRNPDFLDIYRNPKSPWAKEDIVFALDFPYDPYLCTNCHHIASGSGYNNAAFYASAAAVAVEDVNNDQTLLLNHTLRYIWDKNETDTLCNEFKAIRIQLKQMEMGVHGFVGFSCRCLTVAKNAAARNIPLLSMSCSEMDLSNKKEFPTFARTTALNSEVVFMLVSLFKRFNWTRFAIVYEKTHIYTPIYEGLKTLIKNGENLEMALEANYSKKEAYRPNVIHESLAHKFGPFLDLLPQKARIVLLLIDKKYLSEFMEMAEERGLTDDVYAYIAIHPFATSEYVLRYNSSIRDIVWYFSWSLRNDSLFDEGVEKIRKAYQSLMILMPEYPPAVNYDDFKQRVNSGMQKPPFLSEKSNFSVPPPEAGRLYDAVKLYAVGLNRTISQGQDIRNGALIIENIKGLTQTSITGQEFIVNGKADVQKYFEVLQFQNADNITKHPLNCSACWRIKKVFRVVPVYNASQLDLTFKLVESETKPYWRHGRPPLDVPICGFNNEKCQKKEKSPVVIILVSSLIFVALLSIVCLLSLWKRNSNIQKELNSQLWKVDPSDLYFHDWKGASASSLGSWNSETLTISQKFTTVAIYNGTYVALKKGQRESVELTESVLIELKQMRNIRHNNLNQFIGACVEPKNIMTIYQYAAKGSLQDILENSEIKLDTLFILSLIYDIVKGMIYLHSTDIKSHGNLKSSNCVVDSRWVLKVTDYGLDSFRDDCNNSILNYNKLLWKAPELLRSNEPNVSFGTQKGDVYSFAIILQECQTRDGAWGSACQEAETIIERVRRCSNPPYRPIVPQLLDGAEGLRDLMKKCWTENPDDRPYFSELCKDVEGMMKSNNLKTNIFDNMIYMMEKYSTNLEEIVEERTSSLIDEKHKVEGLLERMLPKSVARQLMKGKEVEAETFEEVTIYFSDIVGFTNICASKTPMEVVEMLNCLYTMFDAAAQDYDVYKVETIGDAYMVVSGLPVRNGKQHVKEISLFALDILRNVHSFKSDSTKDNKLSIRVGIHCGPVVAGVVGTTMPRYCLFGDTVNVASRMESTGEALHIQISKYVKNALECFQGFSTEPRGFTTIKGKGDLETFWLTGIDPTFDNRGSNLQRNPNDLYNCGFNSSMYNFIRESPKPKHIYQKSHLTDYIQRSPFISKGGSSETARKNNKDHTNGLALFSPASLKKKEKLSNFENGDIELIDTIDTVKDTDQLINALHSYNDIDPSENDPLKPFEDVKV